MTQPNYFEGMDKGVNLLRDIAMIEMGKKANKKKQNLLTREFEMKEKAAKDEQNLKQIEFELAWNGRMFQVAKSLAEHPSPTPEMVEKIREGLASMPEGKYGNTVKQIAAKIPDFKGKSAAEIKAWAAQHRDAFGGMYEKKKQELKYIGVKMTGPKGNTITTRNAEEEAQYGKAGWTRGTAPTDGNKTAYGKLVDEYMALPDDSPRKKLYERKLAEKGMVIESDGKGGVTIKTNARQDSGLGTAGKNQTDKDLLDTTRGLERVNRIVAEYKPEYQELSIRFGAAWSNLKEKLGSGLNDNEKKTVSEYAAFRMEAIDNINRYIKEITGAQMSEKEADRLTKGMPNPGQGMFDGDGPTQFKAKLDRVHANLKKVAARYYYIKQHGISIKDVSLEDMPGIINRRGKILEAEGQSPDQVRQILANEFGLVN